MRRFSWTAFRSNPSIRGSGISTSVSYYIFAHVPVFMGCLLLLRDRVHSWRTRNLIAIGRMAEQKLGTKTGGLQAHPRMINSILEEGSWIEDSEIQEMWGGLLASSCTESGDDDSNLLFVNLLGGLTRMQAKVVKYACEQAKKIVLPNGLIQANFISGTK